MKPLACAAAALWLVVLAGCATTTPVVDTSAYPPASSDPSHLVFGVHGRSSVTTLENPDLAGMVINAGPIRESVLLSSDSCGQACDVVVTVACSPDLGSGPAHLTATSATGGRELFTATANGSCEKAAAALGPRLKLAFAPGTALYEAAMAEKRTRFNLASPASQEPAVPSKAVGEKPWWEKPDSIGR